MGRRRLDRGGTTAANIHHGSCHVWCVLAVGIALVFFVLLSYLIALSNEMVDVLSFRKPRTQELKRVCANGDDSIFIDNSGENQ